MSKDKTAFSVERHQAENFITGFGGKLDDYATPACDEVENRGPNGECFDSRKTDCAYHVAGKCTHNGEVP